VEVVVVGAVVAAGAVVAVGPAAPVVAIVVDRKPPDPVVVTLSGFSVTPCRVDIDSPSQQCHF